MNDMSEFFNKLSDIEEIISRSKVEASANEIEEIFLSQLDKLDAKVVILRELMEKSKKQGNPEVWPHIIRQYSNLVGACDKLDLLILELRCPIENIPYHNGVDG